MALIHLEVRCCCQPKKLLGYLPVDPQLAIRGARIRFAIPATFPYSRSRLGDGDVKTTPQEVIVLPVESFQSSNPDERHLALKSEETPIETMRRIPGFVENLEAGSPS